MMINKTKKLSSNSRGFTLIELLIAVIIIGILVAIIVPVLATRSNEARRTAALRDLESIATAQEHIAIDTGYFVRLYVMDDGKYSGDNVGSDNPNDVKDVLVDEQFRGDVSRPTDLFIDVETGVFVPPTQNQALYERATRNETAFNWNGPYLNVTRKTKPNEPWAADPTYPSNMPIDPWGNPYLFFTREGIVSEPLGVVVSTPITWPGATGTYSTLIFDRPTVLSMGPDGIPGDANNPTFGLGDDLIKQF